MRKCKGTYQFFNGKDWIKKEFTRGLFHGFSVNYREVHNGVGIFPVAIVELEEGEVITIPADNITFTDK